MDAHLKEKTYKLKFMKIPKDMLKHDNDMKNG